MLGTVTFSILKMLRHYYKVYPLYFFLTIITFAVMIFGNSHNGYEWQSNTTLIDKCASIVTNFTLTRAFFHSFVFIGVPTAWSLTVEECFYLSAPFILFLIRKNFKLIPLFAFIFLLTGMLLTAISIYFKLYALFMRPVWFMLNYTYFGRCVEFLFGISLALGIRNRSAIQILSIKKPTLLGAGIIMLCTCAMMFFNFGYTPTENWPTPFVAVCINNLLLPVGVFILFYGLINEYTLFRRVLETPLFDLLGKSSYAFYLTHIGVFNELFKNVIGQNIFLLFIISNIFSIFLYKFIEHPIHGMILSVFKKNKQATIA